MILLSEKSDENIVAHFGIKKIGLSIFPAVILFIFLLSCEAPDTGGISAGDFDETQEEGQDALTEDIKVFFSDPGSGISLEDPLSEMIDSQEDGDLMLCLYDFDSDQIISAVERAAARGIAVSFVGDPDNADDEGYRRIGNILPPEDFVLPQEYSGRPIMHNKFVVSVPENGKSRLWYGSANASVSDMRYNNNSSLIVTDDTVCRIFTRQMRFLLKRKNSDGDFCSPVSGIERVLVDGVLFEIGFSYAGDLRDMSGRPFHLVNETVASSETDVFFMIFTFGFQDDPGMDLASLLLKISGKVTVRGIFDSSQARVSPGSDVYRNMKDASMYVRLDGNDHTDPFNSLAGGKLHHKVLIIDPESGQRAAVLTGSHNFTFSACAVNAENCVLIHSGRLARLYVSEFERCWDRAASE